MRQSAEQQRLTEKQWRISLKWQNAKATRLDQANRSKWLTLPTAQRPQVVADE